MKTHEIFQAIIDSIVDPHPVVPKTGISGWRHIQEPRPCIENMRFSKGLRTGFRNHVIYAVAVELFRRGWSGENILKECNKLNQSAFLYSLPAAEVAASVRSAGKRNFVHGCRDETLLRFCKDFDGCKWRKAARYHQTSERDSLADFMENWFPSLRSTAREPYLYLERLERERSLPPGSLITQSYRDIAQDLKYRDKGVAIRGMKHLERLGLIEIVGPTILRRRGTESTGLATRFRRILPIPMPGNEMFKHKGV